MGPREIYDVTGDSESAMCLLVQVSGNNNNNPSGSCEEQNPQEEYNCLLLSALATTTNINNNNNNNISLLDESLEDARKVVLNSYNNSTTSLTNNQLQLLPPTQRRRRKIIDEWILAYNRGLVLLAKGQIEASIREAWTYLEPIIVVGGVEVVPDTYTDQSLSNSSSSNFSSSQSQSPPPLELVCRMGFLILEGMLTLYPTRIHGRTTAVAAAINNNNNNYDDGSSFNLKLIDVVLSWLAENVEKTKAPQSMLTPASSSSLDIRDSNNNTNNNNNNDQEEDGTSSSISPDPQLKFLLSLYNSRFDFFERTTGDSVARDKHMRSARKELKLAMEIFQHKLRPSSSPSESSGGGGGGTTNNSNSSTADALSLASVSSYSEEVAAATAGHNNNNNNSNDSSSISKQQQQQTSSPTQTLNSSRPTSAVSSTPVPRSSPADAGGAFNNSNSNLSRILQGQNQAALNLKANAEQLKGNFKKSLILCGEAQSFNNNNTNANINNSPSIENKNDGSSSSSSNYYDAIHQNNLGIVYETSGKSHLALHAFSKAARSANSCNSKNNNSNNRARFESDGTARPDVTLHVLNNAAVCALKSRNFVAAYECYAIGLATSNAWRKRPRTWLRLSEACIGLNTNVKKERTERANQCSKVEIDGKAMGVLLTDTIKYNGDKTVKALPALASPDDMKEIRIHALMRARMALETAIELFCEDGANSDNLALQSARLSLAYVMLEERNFKKALEYSMLVLLNDDGSNNDTTTERSDNHDGGDKTPPSSVEDTVEFVQHTLIKRQKATARMYASEAKASLGDAMASMKLLVGDGKDDAFDRLSSDLGGVTIGMASSNIKAKARLAKAQTMVRCSASAASAALGNVTASKQLAMSAQAMENSYSPSREGTSQARKALIYCMLREGNHGAALTLLRSAR